MPYFIKFLVSEIKGKYSEKTNTCAENDKKIIENKEYLTQEEEVAGKIEWLVVDFLEGKL